MWNCCTGGRICFDTKKAKGKMMDSMADTMGDGSMWTGAGVMSASASGTAIWQFPDKKKRDPALFGTPAAPINIDLLVQTRNQR